MLRPPKAMAYREPEAHLDDAVSQLLELPMASPSPRCGGLTYKDATTLQRLRDRGYEQSSILDAARDLGVTDPAAGLETIQDCLTANVTKRLAERDGTYDCLIARHILEHAQDIQGFLAAIAQLLSPNGLLLVEVPDCARALRDCDYTMLWEEHIAYFTAEALENTVRRAGFVVEKSLVYPYAQENSLVVIARLAQPPEATGGADSTGADSLARNFAERFDEVRRTWQMKLADLRSSLGPVAIFGSGHRTATFIKLHGLEDLIDFVVDEAAGKIGLYLPGTRLRISSPDVLNENSIRVCLLAVSSEYEHDVAERYGELCHRGGSFFSIFPGSDYAIDGRAN